MNLDELERIFRTGDIKFFYTIPRFHNPTGYSYSNEYKKRILLLAEKYDVYIIEDDYLGDLELDLKAEPMHAMGHQQRVVYVKSFSKTLLPGLRLCILVLPKTLSAAYQKAKACCDLITNTLAQGALEIYINSGMFETHTKKIRHYYHHQMQTLKNACTQLQGPLPAFDTSALPETGFFVQISLPDTVSAVDLENALRARNVQVVSSDKMYLPSYTNHHQLRLSICQTDSAQIHQGVTIIADTLRDHMKNTSPEARRSIESFF